MLEQEVVDQECPGVMDKVQPFIASFLKGAESVALPLTATCWSELNLNLAAVSPRRYQVQQELGRARQWWDALIPALRGAGGGGVEPTWQGDSDADPAGEVLTGAWRLATTRL